MPAPSKTMIVAGIMSGTSADGVDIAIARIGLGTAGPRIKLIVHQSHAYPRVLRNKVLEAMDAQNTSVANLSQLHWRLGEHYADCLAKTLASTGSGSQRRPTLIGLHGQTIYHQATAKRYAGKPTRTTWQLGEASVLRERFGIPVVSDFRPADLAAGGQGAPLVPMLDFHLFRHATRPRILLNLGGIANLTVIPPAAAPQQLVAFDTGPANMVLDALTQTLYARPFDRNGRLAASGTAITAVLDKLLRHPYFAESPPKSCGREQFGAAFAARLRALCPHTAPADVLATATELTVRSIARAMQPFLSGKTEVIVAGGGTRNTYLMSRLTEELASASVTTTARYGLPSQAKEGLAFALLGWLTWHGLPGNLPSATGALHPVILGRITR